VGGGSPSFLPDRLPRIVLDALAETQLDKHLQVEARALLDTLGLQELARLLEVLDPPGELDLDRFDRAQGSRRGVTSGSKDRP